MKKKKERNIAGKISGLLEVPLDIVADVPRITINDNRELTVENYKSIESYEPEEIRLRSKSYRIDIHGRALQIVAITDEEILVKGIVSGVMLEVS